MMPPEQQTTLDASALAVAVRAAKLAANHILDQLALEQAESILAQLEAGAHLEVRMLLRSPPCARLILVAANQEREIGKLMFDTPAMGPLQ